MAWKISVSLECDPEVLVIVQQMIFAAAKAQGATDIEAHSVAHSLHEAIRVAGGGAAEHEPPATLSSPVQIDLEYDEETLTLLVREHRASPSGAESGADPGVLH